jgi:hypothetical protein
MTQASAQLLDRVHVMAYEHYRPPLLCNRSHFSQTFVLKLSIAHGKNFIDY